MNVGQFITAVVAGSRVFEASRLIEEIEKGFGATWEYFCGRTLDDTQVISLGYAVSRHVLNKMKAGANTGVSDRAHVFLHEIWEAAVHCGIDLRLDQVDQIDKMNT